MCYCTCLLNHVSTLCVKVVVKSPGRMRGNTAKQRRSSPHLRPCGDVECELHKSPVDKQYINNVVIDPKECVRPIQEVLIPVWVLDGAEVAKTLGRGQWVESLVSDGRGGRKPTGRHQGTTYHEGACFLHKPILDPEFFRDITREDVSSISVTPADFAYLEPQWFIRDIRQVYPCADHAATYPFGDIMGFIKPDYWARLCREGLFASSEQDAKKSKQCELDAMQSHHSQQSQQG